MWRLKLVFLLFIAFSGVKAIDSRIDPLVTTNVGLIRGLRADDGAYSKFLGIPYALVDEETPFAPSTPYPNFEEPFEAYDGSIECPQANLQGQVVGNIQCLQLSVYVPNNAHSKNHLPVMVYIHGGAFVSGYSNYLMGTPRNLVEKDVILVSINYRLGLYGFACTDSPKAPGNVGLRDQLAALTWIKENIESFGGDNSRITIFGESAGAMSVHLQLLSHHDKVFNQAIIHSGPATSPWTIEPIHNDVPLTVARILGFETEDIEEAIDFIAKADVDLAIAAAGQIKSSTQYTNEPSTKACVEREFEGIERFIPENPNVIVPEKIKSIPVMIGFATQELIFQHGMRPDTFFADYSFKSMLSFGFDVTELDEMTDIMKHYYIGDEAPSRKLENEITSFASDFIFNHATKRAVDLMVEGGATVYQFMFSYIGSLSTVAAMNTTIAGSSHADDMYYLFEKSTNSDDISAEDKLTIERLTTLWTNFAKYGNPTPGVTDLLPVKWEPVSKESVPYYKIDKDLSLEHRPYHDRMAFWDLFYKINEDKTVWNA